MKSAATWDSRLEKWRARFAEDALQDRDPPARPTFDAEDDPFFAATTFKDGPMVVAETPRVDVASRGMEAIAGFNAGETGARERGCGRSDH